jgi:hypothetical protein
MMRLIWLRCSTCLSDQEHAGRSPLAGYPSLRNVLTCSHQLAALERSTLEKQIAVDEWVMEIGGGLNVERQRFLKVVDAILAGEVERVVIAHQDRLARAQLCSAQASVRDPPHGIGRDERRDALSRARACPRCPERSPLFFIEIAWPAERPQSVRKGAQG